MAPVVVNFQLPKESDVKKGFALTHSFRGFDKTIATGSHGLGWKNIMVAEGQKNAVDLCLTREAERGSRARAHLTVPLSPFILSPSPQPMGMGLW